MMMSCIDVIAVIDAIWIAGSAWHLLAGLAVRYESARVRSARATRLLIGVLVFCIVGFHKAVAFPVVAAPEYRSATVIESSDGAVVGIESFDRAYERSHRPILQIIGIPLGMGLIIVGYAELIRRR